MIRISNTVGRIPPSQGGGGNTSVKTADGRHMYIKASGTALKDMNETWLAAPQPAQTLAIIRDKSNAAARTDPRTEVTNRLLLVCDDNIKAVGASLRSHLHAA